MPRVVLRLEMFHDSANHHHCERQRPRSFSPSETGPATSKRDPLRPPSRPGPEFHSLAVSERQPHPRREIPISAISTHTYASVHAHPPSLPGSCLARRVELRSAARPLNLSSSVPSSPEHTHSSQSASAESASLSGRRFGRPAQPILLRLGPSHSAQSRVPYSYGTGTAWTSPSFNSVPYSYEFLTPPPSLPLAVCCPGTPYFAHKSSSVLGRSRLALVASAGSISRAAPTPLPYESNFHCFDLGPANPTTGDFPPDQRRAFIPSTIRQPNKALVAPRLRQTVRVLYTSLWTLVTSFTWTPGAVLGAVITTITSSSTTKQATSLATSTSTGRTDIHPHPARPGRTLLQSQRRKRASLVLAQLSRPKTSYAAATSPASPTFATRETLYLGLPSSGLRLIPGRPPLHCLASVPAQQASASTQPAALRLDHRGDAGFPHL
ncbi:hypothetical protein PCL_01644 [Purpureocillium lilacinum]|uniref:Uncharacterized protein n=1 Tax=Purpureocillium lilacinum TaxID=33203 RepID=A0A2U3E219_PURLI|nr:hypothetical protein PCL_01644 [Purpureocillium lilacinum]